MAPVDVYDTTPFMFAAEGDHHDVVMLLFMNRNSQMRRSAGDAAAAAQPSLHRHSAYVGAEGSSDGGQSALHNADKLEHEGKELQQENKELRESARSAQSHLKCKICYEDDIVMVFLP